MDLSRSEGGEGGMDGIYELSVFSCEDVELSIR